MHLYTQTLGLSRFRGHRSGNHTCELSSGDGRLLVVDRTHLWPSPSPRKGRLAQETRHVPRLRADGTNQVWSWDICFLPTRVKGTWL